MQVRTGVIVGVGCGVLALLGLVAAAIIAGSALLFAVKPASSRTSASPPPSRRVLEISGTAKDATLFVYGSRTEQESRWTGTATAFQSAEGVTLAWTNGHVVDQASESSFSLQHGSTSLLVRSRRGSDWLPVHHVLREGFQQRGVDLALLVIPDSDVLPLRVSTTPPSKRDWVLAVGNPVDQAWFTDDGEITDIVRKDTWREFRFDAVMGRGSSGGGVLNEQGELVGIQYAEVFYPNDGRSLGLAIDLSSVRPMFDVHVRRVRADGDWQVTDVVPDKGQWVSIAAVGTWQLGPIVGSCDAIGMTGYEQYRFEPSNPLGSLLVKDDGGTIAVPQLRYCQSEGGPLAFRVNDTYLKDNVGELAVAVVVWND